MTAGNEPHPVQGPIYVYGIVAAGSIDSIDADGVGGADVFVVAHGTIAALASIAPANELRVRRRDLHRHLAVLEEAFAATTVLPFRFGTAVESIDALEDDVLAANRHELEAALERLRGCAQFNVKAEYDEEAVLKEIVTANPDVAALRERTQRLGDAGYYDRIALGERVAAAIADIRAQDAERILAQLGGEVVDVVADDADERFALKASFLVDERGREPFDRKLEAIAREQHPRLRIEVIGPLPPTSFAAGAVGG